MVAENSVRSSFGPHESPAPLVVIVLDDGHLQRLLSKYISYYHEDRTHLGFGKDRPLRRPVEWQPELTSNVVGLPRVGGLHRRYAWRRAA